MLWKRSNINWQQYYVFSSFNDMLVLMNDDGKRGEINDRKDKKNNIKSISGSYCSERFLNRWNSFCCVLTTILLQQSKERKTFLVLGG